MEVSIAAASSLPVRQFSCSEAACSFLERFLLSGRYLKIKLWFGVGLKLTKPKLCYLERFRSSPSSGLGQLDPPRESTLPALHLVGCESSGSGYLATVGQSF